MRGTIYTTIYTCTHMGKDKFDETMNESPYIRSVNIRNSNNLNRLREYG